MTEVALDHDDLMATIEHLLIENAALKRENEALKQHHNDLMAEIREREGEDG